MWVYPEVHVGFASRQTTVPNLSSFVIPTSEPLVAVRHLASHLDLNYVDHGRHGELVAAPLIM